MRSADLLLDAYGRVREEVHRVLDGLPAALLDERIDGTANPIGWLLWHLARVEDDHVSEVAGVEQAWTAAGFADRFALPLEPGDIGYGHTPEQVASVRVSSPALLREYYDAVADRSAAFLAGVTDADLDRVVDDRWDPPVTLGVRLVSVIGDTHQHVGQAAYARGILTGGQP